MLLFQVYIDLNPDYFSVGMERPTPVSSPCVYPGLTSWSSLCRLIRAETLKISQLGYVQAAHAFGVSHSRILGRHILPNVVHIILIPWCWISARWCWLEAVLSYIGVGIDPSMGSWGNMINGAARNCRGSPRCGGHSPAHSSSCSYWCSPPTCSRTWCAMRLTPAAAGVTGMKPVG